MSASTFIGLPVRNGGRHLRVAVDSILSQDFEDWHLLIADNASDDATSEIIQQYCKSDARISSVRHGENIGALDNFLHCVRACPLDARYFVWFAHDDVWQPQFLSATVGALEGAPDASFAWTNVYALDLFDQRQGVAADYSRFSGGNLRAPARFVLEHETCGKAMLIYAVFRPALLHAALDAVGDYLGWGWDNIFNLACLSRGGLLVDKRPLFGKRAPRPTDAIGRIELWQVQIDRRLGLSNEEWRTYFDAMSSVVQGTAYALPLKTLIRYRAFTRQYRVPVREMMDAGITFSEV
jgi:glycosyltransferase involved in cell wall biosynthesis